MSRYIDGVFSESFLSTIGIDFKFKQLEIDGVLLKIPDLGYCWSRKISYNHFFIL